MKKQLGFLFLVVGVLLVAEARSQPFPQVTISNGVVNATLYLPDTSLGFYRGTRFDWSGVIPELVYKGHQYHGEWFTEHDPLGHDGIVGPVEEFMPLGFEHAAPGDTFVKIGVGSLVRPDARPYVFHRRYAFADRGRWQVEAGTQQVDFTHVLNTAAYAYVYNKTVQLPDGAAKMMLIHSLENTGDSVIETRVYNHNFFVIDQEPTGPGYRITLPGDTLYPIGAKGLGDIARLDGNELIFLRGLKRGEQAYFADLGGGQPVDYAITVRNVKSGAGVTITGDRPISKMVFWSSPTTVCPEPYMDVRVAPGETFSWTITYEYHRTTQ